MTDDEHIDDILDDKDNDDVGVTQHAKIQMMVVEVMMMVIVMMMMGMQVMVVVAMMKRMQVMMVLVLMMVMKMMSIQVMVVLVGPIICSPHSHVTHHSHCGSTSDRL